MLTEKHLFCLLSTRSFVCLLFLLCVLQEQTANATDAQMAHRESAHKLRRSADDERVQRRIKEIFRLDSEKDAVVLFNKRPISAQQTPTATNKDFVYPTDKTKIHEFGFGSGSGSGGGGGVISGISTRLNLPEAPLCAENTGKSFCTKVANYPDVSSLEGLLKNDLKRFEPFFGEDLPQPQNISQRINDDPIEEPLCDSQSRIIYPEAGQTRDNDYAFIVNSDTYKQGVRIEECTNKGNECKYTDSFPNGYTTKCKQHYIFRQMVVLTREEKVVKQEIKLPSCCMCVVINTT